jgi:rhodanese-related sulfurtransferase
VLYDTRSAGSYDNQHAAGAISFPESEASLRIDELPTDKTLIFY